MMHLYYAPYYDWSCCTAPPPKDIPQRNLDVSTLDDQLDLKKIRKYPETVYSLKDRFIDA